MFLYAAETNALMAPFENNLINWLILAALLVWLSTKNLPGIFKAREERINSAIIDARKAREEGEAFFAAQKAKIENAEQESAKILDEAKKVAEQIRAQAEKDLEKEAADLAKKIEQAMANERNLAITQLRGQAATAAVRMAEATLHGALNDSTRQRLLKEFADQLDVVGNSRK